MSTNISNLSTITGTTSAYSSVPTTGAAVVSAVTTGHVYRINSVIASNKTATNALLTLVLNRNSTLYYNIAYQMSIPGNTLVSIISKDAPLYMMDTSSDILSAQSNTANAIDVIVCYEDIS
jgi:uncharacterized membrane protein